jgi:hypothetical protein
MEQREERAEPLVVDVPVAGATAGLSRVRS